MQGLDPPAVVARKHVSNCCWTILNPSKSAAASAFFSAAWIARSTLSSTGSRSRKQRQLA